jgi:hypothetical protein
MKIGDKYYIMYGQNYETDYSGKYTVAVLEYNGHYYDKITNYLTLFATIYDSNGTGNFYNEWFGSYEDFIYTGTGVDPVYFITKFNPSFHPSKKMPKGELFENR